MTIFHAVLLGLVEGITEFLPVSSTGHLILFSHLLALPDTEFLKTFEIVIQGAAMIAVIAYYGKHILRKKTLLIPIGIAFIPASIVGLLGYTFLKMYLLGNTILTSCMLIGGGIVFILLENFLKHRTSHVTLDKLSPLSAFIIGIGQSISFIPGVSRAAATMFTGMSIGLNRHDAVEFSFLLAVPTILAASMYDLAQSSPILSSQEIFVLGIGCIISFLSALATIHWLLQFIKKHSFVPFGIYRIILGILFLLFAR